MQEKNKSGVIHDRGRNIAMKKAVRVAVLALVAGCGKYTPMNLGI
jgi:hypothetical protein